MVSRHWITSHVRLVYALAMAVGWILLAVGAGLVDRIDTWANVLLALGVTISATVGISLIQWVFGVASVGIVTAEDTKLSALGLTDVHLHVGDERFYESFASARSIDLLYNTGRNTFQRYMNHIEAAIRQRGCRVRVIVTDPRSAAVVDGANREALCPGTNIEAEIENVKGWLTGLCEKLRQDGVKKGGVEGRFCTTSPTCSIAIVDDHVARYTPYLPHIHSSQVPIFDVENRPDGLFLHYRNSFDRVWSHSARHVFLSEDFSSAKRAVKPS